MSKVAFHKLPEGLDIETQELFVLEFSYLYVTVDTVPASVTVAFTKKFELYQRVVGVLRVTDGGTPSVIVIVVLVELVAVKFIVVELSE